MQLPNGDRAVIEIEKLVGYCLDASHPRGRHKARVFAARLGFTAQHAAELRALPLAAAATAHATPGVADGFGARYVLDFIAQGPSGRGPIRSGWIVLAGEEVPRLTTCYVL